MSNGLVVDENPDAEQGLLVVPGISSGPFGSPFDEVVDEVSNYCSVVRVDAWDDARDLEDMTLKDLQEIVDKAIETLRDLGCREVHVLGKSFGGQLALTYPGNVSFSTMVLWAPAVGLGDNNVEKWRSTPLRQASTATDISVELSDLESLDVPALLIHGEDDQIVDVENSKKISESLPGGDVRVIKNTGHSFENHEDEVAEYTIEFLNQATS